MSFTFEKKHRLLTRKDFGQISRNSQTLNFSKFQLLFKPSQHPHARLGLTASKKFGKAHKRNLFKRRAREVFRHHFKKTPHIEVLLRARNQAEVPTHQELYEAFASIFEPALSAPECN
jgi:ribonuclease P protein component